MKDGDSTSASDKIVASSITFQEQPVMSFWWDSLSLQRMHHKEAGTISGDKFDPSFGFYQSLEKQGGLRLFTMRDGDSLVGYNMIFITVHPHYPSTKWAMQDALYVSQEHRGRKAVEFILWCDEQLHIAGIQYVHRSVSSSGPDYGRTLERLGYREAGVEYIKEF